MKLLLFRRIAIRRCWLHATVWGLMVCHLLGGSAWAQRRAAVSSAVRTETIAAAQAKDIGQDWVRMKYDSKGEPLGMQTAIVHYTATKSSGRRSRPASVDLIAAVHIADAAYYRRLNEQFTHYDALLYELVAPEGTKVPLGRGTSNLHPIGALQNLAKEMLDLDHQLEYIDYTKPNFVHADMSPAEFEKAMSDRNESFLQMYFKLMGAAMAEQSKRASKGDTSDLDLFTALFSTDRSRRLKIVLAKQLSDMEGLMISFGGDQGSAIINERNKKALGVLKTQLAAGKRNVGIFYGAGHLSDMDKHLRADFRLQPESITWFTAWDLAAKP
jgi:hypothetical protein